MATSSRSDMTAAKRAELARKRAEKLMDQATLGAVVIMLSSADRATRDAHWNAIPDQLRSKVRILPNGSLVVPREVLA